MRILMAIDSLIRGGRERRMIELLKGLKKRKDTEVELVIFSNVVEYPEFYDLKIPLHILERKPKRSPKVFFRFYDLCRQFKPDLIHSWGIMTAIITGPSAKRLGVPFINANIADAPNNLGPLKGRFLRAQLSYPMSDVILSNSIAGIKAYKAPRRKSKCIYNGIDLNRIADLKVPDQIREELGIRTSKLVGMVGAFYDRKDYDTYIKAAAIVLDKIPDVSFLAIGEGPNWERCKALVQDKHKDRILFPGRRNDVESIINIFDVGVLSSNSAVHGEGISNAIIEYMLLKKPVVATDGGGTPEIIRPDNGFMVPPFSSEMMAEKIIYLLQNPEKAVQMGINGEQLIRNEFSLQHMEEQYIKLYQNLLAS